MPDAAPTASAGQELLCLPAHGCGGVCQHVGEELLEDLENACMGAYDSPETEYWYNVSPQHGMPIAGEIEFDFDTEKIAPLVKTLAKTTDTQALVRTLAEAILNDPRLFGDIRKLLGVTDKRAYLDLSYIASRTKHPQADTGLCGCHPWNMARHTLTFFYGLLGNRQSKEVRQQTAMIMAQYLLHSGLYEAAKGFSEISPAGLKCVVDSLIVPREAQQREAKRRGHGCEAELARVLTALSVELLPPEKASNPMGARDPNLDKRTLRPVPKAKGKTYAFDMLISEGNEVRVAIQALIHTSDPGQYGVNKSDETVTISEHFAAANTSRTHPIELWGLLDGVGFSENKEDTLNKMLRCFDCFVQLNTLYKAPLRLHRMGLAHVEGISFSQEYTDADVAAISRLYVPNDVRILGPKDRPDASWRAIAAGRGTIFA